METSILAWTIGSDAEMVAGCDEFLPPASSTRDASSSAVAADAADKDDDDDVPSFESGTRAGFPASCA